MPVEAAWTLALNNALTAPPAYDGTLGFFRPDNLTFGDAIYVSRLLATIQAIPGVQNAVVTELGRRLAAQPPHWALQAWGAPPAGSGELREFLSSDITSRKAADPTMVGVPPPQWNWET